MAGMALKHGFQDGQSAAGMEGLVWDGAAGGFVNAMSINPKTGKPYGAAGGGQTPTGYKFNPLTQSYDTARQPGTADGSTGGGGGGGNGGGGGGGSLGSLGGGGGSAGGGQVDRTKVDQLWNSAAPRYDPVQKPLEEGMNPADQAYLNRSKERVGQGLRRSVDALDSQMAQRGFSANSAISGGAMARLFSGAQSDQAETERGLVEGRVARNRDITDWNYNAQNQALQDNQNAEAVAKGRLASLLQYYGMRY